MTDLGLSSESENLSCIQNFFNNKTNCDELFYAAKLLKSNILSNFAKLYS
ncbi:Uncharacterised protein [Bacteroides heparinolyticus]|uniref:Uncharacterized protein n=1 Tax=Prevotella heparinolytica TaxID=28113 RepID=A0A449I4F0_9BACE|nr:Uncharacterised protein [Bacteroides heparinolyticus]